MNNKLNNIFSETDCLKPDILIAYVEYRLSADDRHLVEKHLTDCEMCSDALEGLLSVRNKKELQKIFSSVNTRIDQRIWKKGTKVFKFDFRMRLAAAAMLIAVIGFIFIFKYFIGEQKKDFIAQHVINDNKKTTIQKSSALEKNIETDSDEEQKQLQIENGKGEKNIAANDINESGQKENIKSKIQKEDVFGKIQSDKQEYKEHLGWNNQDEEKGENIDNSVTEKDIDGNPVGTISGMGGMAISDSNEAAISLNVTGMVSQMNTSDYDGNFAKERGHNEKKKDIKAEKPAATSANNKLPLENLTESYDQRYLISLQKYQSGDYLGTINQLTTYILDYPDDYNALYYYGVSYYFLNDFLNAIKYLNKVVLNKNESFYETAQWYLALAHIGNKDINKAKKIFNEIVKSNGSFKTQAEEKLLEIK